MLHSLCFPCSEIYGDVMADKTVCMSAVQARGRHYDVHSLYGWSQTKATLG